MSADGGPWTKGLPMSCASVRAAALAALALAAAASQLRAADWVVAEGRLAGIEGLATAGGVYDLDFRDDSCAALFAGCDRAGEAAGRRGRGALHRGGARRRVRRVAAGRSGRAGGLCRGDVLRAGDPLCDHPDLQRHALRLWPCGAPGSGRATPHRAVDGVRAGPVAGAARAGGLRGGAARRSAALRRPLPWTSGSRAIAAAGPAGRP